MFGFIVISHSKNIAEGCLELVEGNLKDSKDLIVLATGGTANGELGITQPKIREVLLKSKDLDGTLIFTDLGSSILATEMTMEDLRDEGCLLKNTYIVNAPLVEGLTMAVAKWPEFENVVDLKRCLEEYYWEEYNKG